MSGAEKTRALLAEFANGRSLGGRVDVALEIALMKVAADLEALAAAVRHNATVVEPVPIGARENLLVERMAEAGLASVGMGLANLSAAQHPDILCQFKAALAIARDELLADVTEEEVQTACGELFTLAGIYPADAETCARVRAALAAFVAGRRGIA